jgi:TonB family protein
MRSPWKAALFVAVTTSFASGQQSIPAAPSQSADDQPQRVKVYTVGPGVTSPQLLPSESIHIFAGNCNSKEDGKVVLSLIVDERGQPRNITFLHPLGSDLDKLALLVGNSDRFQPGTHDGMPVAVAESVEIELQGCMVQTKDQKANGTYTLGLRSQAIQTLSNSSDSPEEAILAPEGWFWGKSHFSDPQIKSFGGSVKAPILLKAANSQYTEATRKARLEGQCLISLIIDRNGMPQNIRITRSLDPGLDQNAIDAVNHYRFKPAMREGEPIPVQINVEIDFRLH